MLNVTTENMRTIVVTMCERIHFRSLTKNPTGPPPSEVLPLFVLLFRANRLSFDLAFHEQCGFFFKFLSFVIFTFSFFP